MICKYAQMFCWKNVSSFCSAKATHIFSAKNIKILCIESAKIVNEMTLNEFVKLTTLWTTGPWSIKYMGHIKRNQMPSNMNKMHIFTLFCACAKYHPGLCTPFIHFVVVNDSISKQWMLWSDCADEFSHGVAHITACTRLQANVR